LKNTSNGSGGGIVARNNVNIKNSVLRGNVANGISTSTGFGGGMWLFDPGTVYLTNLVIENNRAKRNGGGVLLDNRLQKGRIVVNSIRVRNNHAGESGGGLQGHNIETIYHSRFVGNSSGLRAGGLMLTNTRRHVTSIQNSLIENNHVDNIGGLASLHALGGA